MHISRMAFAARFPSLKVPSFVRTALACLFGGAVITFYLGSGLQFTSLTSQPVKVHTLDMKTVKLVVHPEPFDFNGIEIKGVIGETKERITEIPFDHPSLNSLQVNLPAASLTSPGGEVADEVHIFNPPNVRGGTYSTRKFLFRKGTLIELTMGIDSGELARVIRDMHSL